MDTSVVFVGNIPFYVYYNCREAVSLYPSYRSLTVNENSDGVSLTCFDASGYEVMPYPEYVLALFTYLFEVRGRYKRHMKIKCADGTHDYRFFVDGAHNYGVRYEICKEILTFKLDLPDCEGLSVTDYQGYDMTRLIYVKNLDCFSGAVLKQLRFLSASANCKRAAAYSYMGALRLVLEPASDLTAELLIAIALALRGVGARDFQDSLLYYPSRVLLDGAEPIYFTSCSVGNSLDRVKNM